jgi:hypothetical protein
MDYLNGQPIFASFATPVSFATSAESVEFGGPGFSPAVTGS